MATHWGNEGTLKVGANAVAELDNWSFTLSRDPVNDTSMGDAWESYIAGSGIKKWSGSANCHWDETDANGQVSLEALPSVTLNMYPEGATTGDVYYYGTVEIVEDSISITKDGETIKASFNFTGNGPCTRATV